MRARSAVNLFQEMVTRILVCDVFDFSFSLTLHYCVLCIDVMQAVVVDGVSVGHPCRAIHNCTALLLNNQHIFLQGTYALKI
jgi:hypothetical protein